MSSDDKTKLQPILGESADSSLNVANTALGERNPEKANLLPHVLKSVDPVLVHGLWKPSRLLRDLSQLAAIDSFIATELEFQKSQKAIYVIGSGFAGCVTALEFANSGYKVTLLENSSGILNNSNPEVPLSMSLGFHYVDEDTAINLLKTAIDLMKHYRHNPETDKQHKIHGKHRYFITYDSAYSPEEVVQLYKKLQIVYQEMVDSDPSNQVLGRSTDFFRQLSANEYQNDVNTDKVAMAFETVEASLDWPMLKAHLVGRIQNHDHINLITNSEVIDAKRSGERFVLTVKDNVINSTHDHTANMIVNASWQDIEIINSKMGIGVFTDPRSNSTKTVIEVTLPESLKNKNSLFFNFGTFINLGQGRGLVSYEPLSRESLQATRFLFNNTHEKRKKEFSQQILKEMAEFIPELEHAVPVHIQFIPVKNKSDSRQQTSKLQFKEEMPDWINNACMKLIRFKENGFMTTDIIGKYLAALRTLESIAPEVTLKFATQNFKTKLSDIVEILKKHIQTPTHPPAINSSEATTIQPFNVRFLSKALTPKSPQEDVKKNDSPLPKPFPI